MSQPRLGADLDAPVRQEEKKSELASSTSPDYLFQDAFREYDSNGPIYINEKMVVKCRNQLGRICLDPASDLSSIQDGIEMLRVVLEACPVGSSIISHDIVSLAKKFVEALPVDQLENLPREVGQQLLHTVFLIFEQIRLETELGVLGGITESTKTTLSEWVDKLGNVNCDGEPLMTLWVDALGESLKRYHTLSEVQDDKFKVAISIKGKTAKVGLSDAALFLGSTAQIGAGAAALGASLTAGGVGAGAGMSKLLDGIQSLRKGFANLGYTQDWFDHLMKFRTLVKKAAMDRMWLDQLKMVVQAATPPPGGNDADETPRLNPRFLMHIVLGLECMVLRGKDAKTCEEGLNLLLHFSTMPVPDVQYAVVQTIERIRMSKKFQQGNVYKQTEQFKVQTTVGIISSMLQKTVLASAKHQHISQMLQQLEVRRELPSEGDVFTRIHEDMLRQAKQKVSVGEYTTKISEHLYMEVVGNLLFKLGSGAALKNNVKAELALGNTVLHIASQFTDHSAKPIVESILTHIYPTVDLQMEAITELRDKKLGRTPLHVACSSGCLPVVKYMFEVVDKQIAEEGKQLIKQGADKQQVQRQGITKKKDILNLKDSLSRLPIHYAGSRAVFDFLCRAVETNEMQRCKVEEELNVARNDGENPLKRKGSSKPLQHIMEDTFQDQVADSQGSRLKYLRARDNAGNEPAHTIPAADALRELLKEVPEAAKSTNNRKETPLHCVVNEELVSVLCDDQLRVEVDIEAKRDDGKTPLLVHCMTPKPNVVKALLDVGAEVQERDTVRNTVFHEAHMSVLKLLDKLYYAHSEPVLMVALPNASGDTPLHVAKSVGALATLLDIEIKRSAAFHDPSGKISFFHKSQEPKEPKEQDIVRVLHSKGQNGKKVLHNFCHTGNARLVHFLLQKYGELCDLDAVDNDGISSSTDAAANGNYDVVSCLEEFKEKLPTQRTSTREDMTKLFILSCRKMNPQGMRDSLRDLAALEWEKGLVDCDIKDVASKATYNGTNCFMEIASYECAVKAMTMLELLFDEIDTLSAYLHLAKEEAEKHNQESQPKKRATLEEVRERVRQRERKSRLADNRKLFETLNSSNGKNVLHYVKHPDLLKKLCETGLSMVADDEGLTPLHYALRIGDKELVSQIMDSIVSKKLVAIAPGGQEPYLFSAITYGMDMVRLVVRSRSELEELPGVGFQGVFGPCSLTGKNALHFACRIGQKEVADRLMKNRDIWQDSLVFMPDFSGRFPVHDIALGGSRACADLPFPQGAWHIPDVMGDTAAALAQRLSLQGERVPRNAAVLQMASATWSLLRDDMLPTHLRYTNERIESEMLNRGILTIRDMEELSKENPHILATQASFEKQLQRWEELAAQHKEATAQYEAAKAKYMAEMKVHNRWVERRLIHEDKERQEKERIGTKEEHERNQKKLMEEYPDEPWRCGGLCCFRVHVYEPYKPYTRTEFQEQEPPKPPEVIMPDVLNQPLGPKPTRESSNTNSDADKMKYLLQFLEGIFGVRRLCEFADDTNPRDQVALCRVGRAHKLVKDGVIAGLDKNKEKPGWFAGAHLLHWAALGGNASALGTILDAMLEENADALELRTKKGQTPLLVACSDLGRGCCGDNERTLSVIKELLGRKANINAKLPCGASALHLVAGAGISSAVPLLVTAGLSVDAEDDAQLQPLHFAVDAATVKSLLARRANPAATASNSGLQPVHTFASGGRVQALKELVSASPSALDATTKKFRTPLMEACCPMTLPFSQDAAEFACVRTLLEPVARGGLGATVARKPLDIDEKDGTAYLHKLLDRAGPKNLGSICEAMGLLITAAPQLVNAGDIAGKTPVFYVRHSELLLAFLQEVAKADQQVNLDHRDEAGRTCAEWWVSEVSFFQAGDLLEAMLKIRISSKLFWPFSKPITLGNDKAKYLLNWWARNPRPKMLLEFLDAKSLAKLRVLREAVMSERQAASEEVVAKASPIRDATEQEIKQVESVIRDTFVGSANQNPLFDACHSPATLKELLKFVGGDPYKMTEESVRQTDNIGRTLFMYAICLEEEVGTKCMESLLVQRADVGGSKDNDGRTAIFHVKSSRQLDMVRSHVMNVEKTSDPVWSCDIFDQTPLFTAVFSGRHDVVARLLELCSEGGRQQEKKGRDAGDEAKDENGKGKRLPKERYIGHQDVEGATVIHHVSDPTMLRTLLENKADLNATSTEQKTALHFQAARGNTWMVQALLDRGISLRADIFGRTSLHESVLSGSIDTVSCLIEAGFNVMDRDDEGQTPLHYAVKMPGNKPIVTILCEAGANPDAVDNNQRTPLHNAIIEGHFDMYKCLFDFPGADHRICATDSKKRNVYHMCCENNTYIIANDIMQCEDTGEYPKLDVNACDIHGDSPLHMAVALGSRRMVQLLLQHPRINMQAVNREGWSPMHVCAKLGNSDIIKILCKEINLKESPTMRDLKDVSISCCSETKEGRQWPAREFLEGEKSKPISPLLLAIEQQHVEVVKYFCSPAPKGLGCDVNKCKNTLSGDGPMHTCAPNGDHLIKTGLVTFLLDSKQHDGSPRGNFANVHELNNVGQDPAAIAQATGQEQFVNLMNKIKLEVVHGTRTVDGATWSGDYDHAIRGRRLQLFDEKLRPHQHHTVEESQDTSSKYALGDGVNSEIGKTKQCIIS